VSGSINKCGVCDGPSAAVTSATGECCTNGVTDSTGLCCPSGNLDSFGVCDGGDASGQQTVTMGVSGVTVAGDPTDPTDAAFNELGGAIKGDVAGSLGRDEADVDVSSIKASSRRRRVVAVRQLTGGSYQADVVLLPYGGPNALPDYVLESSLVHGSALFTFDAFVGASVSGVCGNGACEAGERPDANAGVTGCPADCPYPVVTCAGANGRECNGAGLCVASSGGVGSCLCYSSGGYGGDACDSCASGYTSNGAGYCEKVVSSVQAPPKKSSDDVTGAVVGGVVGGGGGAIAVALVVYFLVKRNGAQNKPAKPVSKLQNLDEATEEHHIDKDEHRVGVASHIEEGAVAADAETDRPAAAATGRSRPLRVVDVPKAAPGFGASAAISPSDVLTPVEPTHPNEFHDPHRGSNRVTPADLDSHEGSAGHRLSNRATPVLDEAQIDVVPEHVEHLQPLPQFSKK